MNDIKLFSIGKVQKNEGDTYIKLDKKFMDGIKGLNGYSYVQVIWWMDKCDNESDRTTIREQKPYVKGPGEIGVFALRSPERPNPIAVSNSYITYIDEENGVIGLAYIDADEGSTILDLKPYTPSIDRVENPITPEWCSHWPSSVEESGNFDWEKEFNF